MRYVSCFDWFEQHLCPESEYRRPGPAGAAGFDLLHDFYSGLSSSQIRLSQATIIFGPEILLDDKSLLLNIDVEKRTTRGRSCPRCGGKIIPSERAVYQNAADPSAIYPAWQCERCGYEELVERAKPAAKKH
jgi:DNA-directed RNA polymerase subunit RPC12/RpoP